MKIIKFKNGGELVKIDDHNWMCNNLPSRFGLTMSSYHLDECPDYPEDMIDDDTLKEEYGTERRIRR